MKAPSDAAADLKARPSRPGWVPAASRYVQALNGAYFNLLKWCWEVDERVIDPEADEAVGETTPDSARGGAAPQWLESDQVTPVRPSGNEPGPQADTDGPPCAPANTHLHSYRTTYFDSRQWDWWEHKDTWPWARNPVTFIDQQATIPKDPIPVRCGTQGIYVSCKLERPGVLTRCECCCDQCKQVRRREATRTRNKYLEAARKDFFEGAARARE
eukprot:1528972-Rhodomonas_salina.2